MEYNAKYEEILAKPTRLQEAIKQMDSKTLSDFYVYIVGRIDYVDAEESLAYWYAASLLDGMVEFVSKEDSAKRI